MHDLLMVARNFSVANNTLDGEINLADDDLAERLPVLAGPDTRCRVDAVVATQLPSPPTAADDSGGGDVVFQKASQSAQAMQVPVAPMTLPLNKIAAQQDHSDVP
jgi:hypothetical protein